MITKELFIELLEKVQKHDAYLDTYDIIQFDHPFVDFGFDMFTRLLNIYFTETGVDWITWYLWERDVDKYYWIGDVQYEVPDLESLWELVKPYARTYN